VRGVNTAVAPSGARLGLRLPPAQIPAVSWGRWEVVPRSNGFHVSRESAGGRVEVLLNEVRKLKVFRSRPLADKACAAANFDATATALKAEPLLGGKGGAS
jgi:hypothetical protein